MRRLMLFVASVFSFVASCSLAATNADAVAEVTKIERGIEKFFNSDEYRKNPASSLVYFENSDEMHFFDMAEPGEYAGDAFRKHFVEMGGGITGKLKFLNLKVYADENLAFAHYTQHFAGKDAEGHKLDMKIPTTDCFRKTDGKWKIVHMHESVFVDEATLMKMMSPKK